MRGFLSKSEYYTIFVFYPLIRTGPVFGEQATQKMLAEANGAQFNAQLELSLIHI